MIDDYQNIFNTTATIIDLGSGMIKAGSSGEEKPTCIFPSIIGYPKFNKILPINEEKYVVGPERSMRGLYRLERPINRGILSNADDAKIIFQKIFTDLKLTNNNKEIPVFIAEPPFTSKKQKSMLSEILFDSFDIPSLFFGTQGVLSLYSFGKKNGVVLESGEGITQVVPVYNGYKLDYAVEKIDFGGIDVSNYLKLLLCKNGVKMNSSSEFCILQEIKETISQLKEKPLNRNEITMTVDVDNNKTEEIKYELPDGEKVEVGSERFFAPEILFNPSIGGLEFPGLHQFLNNSIKKLDLDLRKNLYSSIILSGGNTLINGFSERLANELEAIVSEKTKLSITAANTDRTFLAWQGASNITNIGTFAKLWISKKEYQEQGDRIFLMKTF